MATPILREAGEGTAGWSLDADFPSTLSRFPRDSFSASSKLVQESSSPPEAGGPVRSAGTGLRPAGAWSFTEGGVDTGGGEPGRGVPTGPRACLEAVLRCRLRVGGVGAWCSQPFQVGGCWGARGRKVSCGCGLAGMGEALGPCCPQAFVPSAERLLWPLAVFQTSWGARHRFSLTQWLSAIPSRTACPLWCRCLAP